VDAALHCIIQMCASADLQVRHWRCSNIRLGLQGSFECEKQRTPSPALHMWSLKPAAVSLPDKECQLWCELRCKSLLAVPAAEDDLCTLRRRSCSRSASWAT
jgi:hypothetical protein